MTGHPLKITFLQGQESLIDGDDLESNLDKIKQKISDLSNVKNVHFLLGAGTSSGAIPTMKDMVESIDLRLTHSIPPKPLFRNVSHTVLQALFNKVLSDN